MSVLTTEKLGSQNPQQTGARLHRTHAHGSGPKMALGGPCKPP